MLGETARAAAVGAEAGLTEWFPAAQVRFLRAFKVRGADASPVVAAAAAALGVALPG